MAGMVEQDEGVVTTEGSGMQGDPGMGVGKTGEQAARQ